MMGGRKSQPDTIKYINILSIGMLAVGNDGNTSFAMGDFLSAETFAHRHDFYRHVCRKHVAPCA